MAGDKNTVLVSGTVYGYDRGTGPDGESMDVVAIRNIRTYWENGRSVEHLVIIDVVVSHEVAEYARKNAVTGALMSVSGRIERARDNGMMIVAYTINVARVRGQGDGS